ncbi:cellulase/cellobiase CelA1, partial [Chryseobacterium lathyri]|nr:cellulase/cellobiase CelA1 [Chryseobacterium lathyri]
MQGRQEYKESYVDKIIQNLPNGKYQQITIANFAKMNELINYILHFGDLNQQQVEFIKSKTIELELKKDDYFSEAGKIPKYIGFVLEGVFRFC